MQDGPCLLCLERFDAERHRLPGSGGDGLLRLPCRWRLGRTLRHRLRTDGVLGSRVFGGEMLWPALLISQAELITCMSLTHYGGPQSAVAFLLLTPLRPLLSSLACHMHRSTFLWQNALVSLPDEPTAYTDLGRPRHADSRTGNASRAWAGTTLSVLRVDGLMGPGCRMFDTPGVPHSHQLTSLLTLPEVSYTKANLLNPEPEVSYAKA